MTTPTEQIQEKLQAVLELGAKENAKMLAAEILAIVTEALNGDLTPPVSLWVWGAAPKQLKDLFAAPNIHDEIGGWVIMLTKDNQHMVNSLPIDLSTFDVVTKELWDGATILLLH
jgi:hypothetical protein